MVERFNILPCEGNHFQQGAILVGEPCELKEVYVNHMLASGIKNPLLNRDNDFVNTAILEEVRIDCSDCEYTTMKVVGINTFVYYTLMGLLEYTT